MITLKLDQTKNSDLEIFQTVSDRLNHQTEPVQIVLERSNLVYGFSFFFLPKLIQLFMQTFRTYPHRI